MWNFFSQPESRSCQSAISCSILAWPKTTRFAGQNHQPWLAPEKAQDMLRRRCGGVHPATERRHAIQMADPSGFDSWSYRCCPFIVPIAWGFQCRFVFGHSQATCISRFCWGFRLQDMHEEALLVAYCYHSKQFYCEIPVILRNSLIQYSLHHENNLL